MYSKDLPGLLLYSHVTIVTQEAFSTPQYNNNLVGDIGDIERGES